MVLAGVILGGMYALIAMGLTLQYGVARIMNLSYGEFLIAAAFVAFIVGGTFTAIAWNEVVWCLFAVLAALDRLSLADAKRAPAVADPARRELTWKTDLDGWRPASAR